MKVTVNKRLNVGYIQFRKARIAKTVKFRRNLLIDMNSKGEVVGIELLDVAGSPKVQARPKLRATARRTKKLR